MTHLLSSDEWQQHINSFQASNTRGHRQAGARALCLHFSVIRTAKLHGLDPYRYYVEILKAAPHCESVSDYEALLPWNIQLNKEVLAHAA